MTAVRFLIAKYVPDLRRMEPRNVGVIVWQNGDVAAHFVAERPDRPGEVDGRSVPGFVTSVSAYKQWVRYWRKQLEKPSIRPLQGGEAVPRSAPEYIALLIATSRENFHLVESGMLLDRVEGDALPQVADYLFNTLVEGPLAVEEARDPSLEDVCQKLIEETHLDTLPYFRRNYALTCRVREAEETFEFSFAYGNGNPVRLYQQLPLPRRRSRRVLNRNVHHVAWMFEKVLDAKVIAPEQGVVLVFPTEEQLNDSDVAQSLQMLGSMTRVLNLQEYDQARNEFQGLSHLDVGHTEGISFDSAGHFGKVTFRSGGTTGQLPFHPQEPGS